MRGLLSSPLLQSLRVRLTLWYVALLALVLLLFSGILYVRLDQTLRDNLDDTLRNRADVLVGTVVDVGGEPRLLGVEPRASRMQGESFARLFDGRGAIVSDDSAAIGAVPLFADDVATAQRGVSSFRSVAVGDTHLRVFTAPLRASAQGVLQIGVSEDDLRDILTVLLAILVVLIPVMLLIASGGGLFLARRALAPVDRMSAAARQIEATDLSRRLPTLRTDDEIGRLARTLNELIARLEAAFARQRQFTADASHELRTPLTIMRGELDVTLRRERTPKEYQDTLARVREEVAHLQQLAADLLLLARRNDDDARILGDIVDLAAVVSNVCATLEPLAQGREQTLTLTTASAPVVGDADDLARLVRNLVENALRYTPEGGRITVAVRREGERVAVQIADTGVGIASDALPYVFARFYRADTARARASGGSGLGLAIAQAIAQRHGGTITAESAIGRGSTFTAMFPAAEGKIPTEVEASR